MMGTKDLICSQTDQKLHKCLETSRKRDLNSQFQEVGSTGKLKIPADQESNPGREDQRLEVGRPILLADYYSRSSSSKPERYTTISQCASGNPSMAYKCRKRLSSCLEWISTFYPDKIPDIQFPRGY